MAVTGRAALLAVAMLVLAACGAGGSGVAATGPAPAPAAVIDLPGAAEPEALAASNGTVLVAVRRDDRPGLVRRAPDGTLTELPVTPSSGYGASAHWYAITADGDRVLAVGGDRGGAHGNVRWSVWTGSPAGITEHSQAFSTFGGWGAGDVIGAVFTPTGPVLVGSWESAVVGSDVVVWTAAGDEWNRTPSAGTPLESTRTTLNFALAATRGVAGALVVGWRSGAAGQTPAVWSQVGAGWEASALPDGGRIGVALAASCAQAECAVAGRVDGLLALWRFVDGRWTRVAGLPPIAVGDRDPIAAPILTAGRIVQVAADGARVVTVDVAASGATTGPIITAPVAAVTGPVRAAVAGGADAYVLAGAPARAWRFPGLLTAPG